MNRLLAIDPGKTTGFVELRWSADKSAIIYASGEIESTPANIKQMVQQFRGNQIVMEDWKYVHNKPVDARDACIPMGMVMAWAYDNSILVRLQDRQFRTSIGDIAETLGSYWLPNLKPHDDRRQALRHGLAYLTHTLHHLPTMEKLRPRT